MSTVLPPISPNEIEYPESDGQPMADNTLQFEWIVTIKGGLDAVYRDRDDVFVAGDLFWYPTEGNNRRRVAPDVLVVFGRSKGHRRSYLQWREGNIAPQVVFEILSEGKRPGELMRKFAFYQQFGVEEYYLFDPEARELFGWQRQDDLLLDIPRMDGWTSPRLNIRFDLSSGDLRIFGPGGDPFKTYLEIVNERDAVAEERDAVAKRLLAEQGRANRLAAQLQALGIEPIE